MKEKSHSKKYKEYNNEYNKKRYLESRQIIKELKLNGCAICGYNKSQKALHFHHINKKDGYGINMNTITYSSNNTLIKELTRCILLCANCHYEIHEQ